VRVSHRLIDSPSCIVLGEYDMALHMQRLLREAGHDVPDSKPTLEVNPEHALLRRFVAETDSARSEDLARLLFEEAQLAAGDQLTDPVAFIARVNRIALAAN
jgi:molecular chaperone HtpG